MTRFTHARTKRRNAIAMLLLWLFALGASWANACVLQARSTERHVAAGAAPASFKSFTRSASDAVDVADHGDEKASGEAACLKFCDDRLQSAVKGPLGVDLTDSAAAPPMVVAWTVGASTESVASRQRDFHATRAALPLRIRYSRLTL